MTPLNLLSLISFFSLRNIPSEPASSQSSLSNANYTIVQNKTNVLHDELTKGTIDYNQTVENSTESSSVFARHALQTLRFQQNSKKGVYSHHRPAPPLLPPLPPLHYPVKPLYPPGPLHHPPVPILHPPLLPLPHHIFSAHHSNPKPEYEKLQVGYGTVLFNGKDAVLKCHFPEDTYIISNVVWHKQDYPNFGVDYRHFERTHGHISVLSINDVNPKDFGVYTCALTGGKRNAHPITLYQEVNFYPSQFLHNQYNYGGK